MHMISLHDEDRHIGRHLPRPLSRHMGTPERLPFFVSFESAPIASPVGKDGSSGCLAGATKA
jgi:hypothetical protein